MGVPVFAADVKGDLSGLLQAGRGRRPGHAARHRPRRRVDAGRPSRCRSSRSAVSAPGVPVRATVSSFGPQLLAKVLGANETQSSSLSLVFDYADKAGLALVDLDDLRAVLQYLTSDDGKAELQGIGGLSSATAGVLLRKIVELEQQGAEAFFGEPELDTADLMQRDAPTARASSAASSSSAVQDKPRLFSTFLMWLLADLFQTLPGDRRRRPAEAGVLLRRGTPAVRGRAEGVRRPGRADRAPHPLEGRRRVLRHPAARRRARRRARAARQPRAARAARVHAPRRQGAQGRGHHLPEDRRLRPRGRPHPARHRRGDGHDPLRARRAHAGGVDAAATAVVADGRGAHRRRSTGRRRPSPLWPEYAEEIDPESAREKLTAKLAASAADAAPAPARAAKKAAAKKAGGARRPARKKAKAKPPQPPTTATRSPTSSSHARAARP